MILYLILFNFMIPIIIIYWWMSYASEIFLLDLSFTYWNMAKFNRYLLYINKIYEIGKNEFFFNCNTINNNIK